MAKKRDPKVGTGKKPKGSDRRLYTDENPKDTVGIKFATPADARKTVAKVKKISKPFARKIQILTVGEQRAKVMGKTQAAAVYRAYINKMKEKTKKMRKEYMTFSQFANLDLSEKAPNTSDAMKRYRAGKAGFTDKAHLKAKGLIPRSDGTKRKSDKYK